MRYRVMFSCESAMFSWESAGLSGPPREAAPAEPRETAQCTSWRRTRGPGLATHIVFHRADAGPRRKHAGKLAVTWTGPAENRLAPAIRATFQASVFSAALKNGAVPQGWGQPPAIRGEATSPGPRKRPGRPPATPGRPDPGRVARGPRKHVAFAPRGGTFPIVLRIRRTLIASGTIKHVTFAKWDATFSIVSRIPGENDTIPR